jgi:hypothetical protein
MHFLSFRTILNIAGNFWNANAFHSARNSCGHTQLHLCHGESPTTSASIDHFGKSRDKAERNEFQKKINERTAQLNHMTKNRFHRKKNLNNPSLNTESSKIRAIH